jgi:hypothetical protein
MSMVQSNLSVFPSSKSNSNVNYISLKDSDVLIEKNFVMAPNTNYSRQ